MRILVTGASGQLARSLAALDESQPGLAIVVHGRPELDLENPDIIGSLISHVRPDVVVNAAAYTAVDAAERDNTRAFAVNAGKFANYWNHGVSPFVGSSYEMQLKDDISMRTQAAINGNPNLG